MTHRPQTGLSIGSIVRSVTFLVAALVVLDYLIPQKSGWLLAGGVAALIAAAVVALGRGSKPVRAVQSLLVATTISLAIAIIGVEILFRIFLLRPGVPSTDEDFSRHISAFWPAPIERSRSPERLRIVGLADSFGRAGEEDNFLYVAGRELGEAGQPNEVVNLSEWGLELRDELELFQRFGPDFEPDLVLHSFFVGNDFDLPTEDLAFFGTVPMRWTPGLSPLRPRWFLHRRWLESCWRARRDQKQARQGGFSDVSFLSIEKQRLRKWSDRGYLDRVWPEVETYLDAIRQQAEEAGAGYAMVIQPDQYQVDPVLRQRLAEWAGVQEGEIEMSLPQDLLREYCEDAEIACLDLLPTLQGIESPESLYLNNDTHYNLKGNAVVGQATASFVQRSILESESDRP